ncbi:Ubiquitin-like activating enzyme 4 [Carabus blaptoides fortunei]
MENKEVIAKLQAEIEELKKKLTEKEAQLLSLNKTNVENSYCNGLSAHEVSRYSRQMIMSQITTEGQIKLKNSKVLVVGAGGLGCPASLYLAAAGVGSITLIDNDTVEMSNLHRQVLHTEQTVGMPKVESAKLSLNRLNSHINIITLHMHLNSTNITNLLKDYDVIIDGTDNVATRYLLNDACVIQGKPLVSGSALQFEGQLTVYHYRGGPCYRCLFPVPPPPETVTSCGDGGVLGVVPGCIGILQALETIKILVNMPNVLAGRLLLFDGSNTTFRNVQLRKRNPQCAVCGDIPTVTAPIDYEQFCRSNAHDNGDMISILSKDERISVLDYDKLVKQDCKHLLLDVRSELEFQMCRLPESVNVPFTDIQKRKSGDHIKDLLTSAGGAVYVLCRRGNDSQRAVGLLKDQFGDLPLKFKDIIGGLHAYALQVDPQFPIY